LLNAHAGLFAVIRRAAGIEIRGRDRVSFFPPGSLSWIAT